MAAPVAAGLRRVRLRSSAATTCSMSWPSISTASQPNDSNFARRSPTSITSSVVPSV